MIKINEVNIFKYKDYRKYIINRIECFPKFGHGIRTKLASILNCRPSFITHVLNNRLDFTSEQALKIAVFFKLNDGEIDYFLLLIRFERAGNTELKSHIKKQIEKSKIYHITQSMLTTRQDTDISNNYQIKDISIFTTSWPHMAVILLIAQEVAMTKSGLAKHLTINEDTLTSIIKDLINVNIVKMLDKNRLYVSKKDYEVILSNIIEEKNFHITWRNKLIDKLQTTQRDLKSNSNIHYTLPVCLPESVILDVKSILEDAIFTINSKIKNQNYEKQVDQLRPCAISIDIANII